MHSPVFDADCEPPKIPEAAGFWGFPNNAVPAGFGFAEPSPAPKRPDGERIAWKDIRFSISRIMVYK